MFREMRRAEKAMKQADVDALIERGEYGVLSTIDPEGYPYGVPVSYVYHDEAIYIHGATEGEKLDNINENNHVAFCIVDRTEVLPEQFTTRFESLVIFGRAYEVDEDREKVEALTALAQKYSPKNGEKAKKYIKSSLDKCTVIRIDIKRMTGKYKK